MGKFYKTRDGRKAWVVSQEQGAIYPYVIAILGKVNTCCIRENGLFYANEENDCDIVAPWDE